MPNELLEIFKSLLQSISARHTQRVPVAKYKKKKHV